ncbi:MAG: HAD family phosphatase [Trueperaceae bacterium]
MTAADDCSVANHDAGDAAGLEVGDKVDDDGGLAMIERFEAIFLDMDGTLVDTEELWFNAERQVAARFGAAVPPEAATELHGLDTEDLVRRLCQRYSLATDPETFVSELLAEVLTRLPTASARDGAASLVERLAAAASPRAIVSNSPCRMVSATLTPHTWAGLLPRRFSVDEVTDGKPQPDLYLHAARALATPPQRCLALEDSPTGALAAVRAGMTCIAVTFEQRPPEAFHELTGHVVPSLEAAERLLFGRSRYP